MNIFLYDHTFEGLLTSVFEAYSRRTFPRCAAFGRRAASFVLRRAVYRGDR